MVERYDSVRDAEAAEYLPLARAAALVHARLFPQESAKDVKTLDLLGLAISALIPLYQRDMKSGAVRALDGADIARGRFTRGASRLEIAGRAPLRFLLVSLPRALPGDRAHHQRCPPARARRPHRRSRRALRYLDFGDVPPMAGAGVFFCPRRLIRPSTPSCFTTASNSLR